MQPSEIAAVAAAPHQVLRGAQVIDGTGTPGRRVDVETAGGRIVSVGSVPRDTGAVDVDLSGLVLAPGIIDPHTHFDTQQFWDPDFTPSNVHGITSVIEANCGFGLAPTRPGDRAVIEETFENVEGMSLATLRAGLPWSFETFPQYMDVLRAMPKRMNVATYVGHTPLRIYVMGADAATERPARQEEVSQMAALVAEAVRAGAIGFATSQAASQVGAGGRPIPSRQADPGEIRALMAAGAAAGGRIASLTYGPDYGLVEAAQLSKELGIRLTWGSLLSDLHGPPGVALDLLEQASAVGGDIWPQISTRFITLQVQLSRAVNFFMPLPSFADVLARRGLERMQVYRDPAWQERARAEAASTRLGYFPRWERFWVDETEVHAGLRGRSLADLSAEQGRDPFDVMLELAMAEQLETRFRVAVRNVDEAEVAALLRDRRTLVGSHDAGAHIDIICDACYPTHVLAHWVRDRQEMDLSEAIWRMTGQVAEIFGLHDRGTISPGRAADLFAFDPETVGPAPTERVWDFPAGGERLVIDSCGVVHTWVNGRAVRRDGVDLEGARPGVLLGSR